MESKTSNPHPATAATRAAVLWIIWSALFAVVFIYRVVLLPPAPVERPTAESIDPVTLSVLLGSAMASLAIRILLLPRASDHGKRLVSFILGMTLAEGLVFYGIFLFPRFEPYFFGTCLVLMLAYCPLFIRVSEEKRWPSRT